MFCEREKREMELEPGRSFILKPKKEVSQEKVLQQIKVKVSNLKINY